MFCVTDALGRLRTSPAYWQQAAHGAVTRKGKHLLAREGYEASFGGQDGIPAGLARGGVGTQKSGASLGAIRSSWSIPP